MSDLSQGSRYSAGPSGPLSEQDFLSRVDAVKRDMRTLSTQFGTLQDRSLSNLESNSSQELESDVSSTQLLNTRIHDQIKFLASDTEKTPASDKAHAVKSRQLKHLRDSFRRDLEGYQRNEATYRRRYRENIARQYLIVNPNATEEEVQEAADADWGNEGVFQTAVSHCSLRDSAVAG
jgi:syntaxin 1B/2/3